MQHIACGQTTAMVDGALSFAPFNATSVAHCTGRCRSHLFLHARGGAMSNGRNYDTQKFLSAAEFDARFVGDGTGVPTHLGIFWRASGTSTQTPSPASSPEAVGPEAALLKAHPAIRKLGRRGRLPGGEEVSGSGILYVFHDEEQGVDVVVADSLADAIAHLDDDEVAGEMSRRKAFWAPGDRASVVEASPALDHVKAGRQAHPHYVTSVADWGRIPSGAGVYRIFLLDETGENEAGVYVGRTSNFKRRPRQHEKVPRGADGNQQFGGPNGVEKIELIYAKSGSAQGVWSSIDLDDLEEVHIARARDRHERGDGPPVLNDYIGRNGPPSKPGKPHYFRWTAGD